MPLPVSVTQISMYSPLGNERSTRTARRLFLFSSPRACGEKRLWVSEVKARVDQLRVAAAESLQRLGRLGAQVSNFHPAGSSVRKGESLIDTALTLNAMQPDLLVIRHEANGAAAEVAQVMDCPVINAGDGRGEHPTQALLDALTIRRRFGRIDGLKIAICGDIRHSRVANSNLRSLPMLGARLKLVAPASLMPESLPEGVEGFDDLERGIEGADVVMMLRIQRERMEEAVSGSLGDFHDRYGLTRERLNRAAPDAIVMHPGPMNRGVEIDSEVADDDRRSVILEQVELGVAVRMACLDLLTRPGRDL